MTKYCAGRNCPATEDHQVPHSKECQFEHMCAVKQIDDQRLASGAFASPKAQEAWAIWDWAWGASRCH